VDGDFVLSESNAIMQYIASISPVDVVEDRGRLAGWTRESLRVAKR
jgi:glutathione S-transferase